MNQVLLDIEFADNENERTLVGIFDSINDADTYVHEFIKNIHKEHPNFNYIHPNTYEWKFVNDLCFIYGTIIPMNFIIRPMCSKNFISTMNKYAPKDV